MLLAAIEPIIDPTIIPGAHFLIILKSTFLSKICDLIDEMEVKIIMPRDVAIETCIITSLE